MVLVSWALLKIINEQNSRVLEKLKNSNSRVLGKFLNSIERNCKNIIWKNSILWVNNQLTRCCKTHIILFPKTN